MNKDDKIKELQLEIARLQGIIEGMQKADPYRLYPRPYPVPVVTPYPYYPPVWYQTYCTNTVNSGAIAATNTTVGTESWQ